MIEFERPPERVKEWDDFVRRIWTYQWVRNPGALDEEMLDTIFDLSQSIPDFVVLLFKLAQQRAMLDKTETLTPKLLRQTYDDAFVLLHPAINALRKNTAASLSQYEDLLPVDEALQNLLELPKHTTVVEDYLEQLFPTTAPLSPATTSTECTPKTQTYEAETASDVGHIKEGGPTGGVDIRTAADAQDPHQDLVDKGVISHDGLDLGMQS